MLNFFYNEKKGCTNRGFYVRSGKRKLHEKTVFLQSIKHGLPLPVYRGYEKRRGQDFPRGRRSVDDFISGKILYFCIHDVERLGFGGYGTLGEPPAAGEPAAV